MTAIVAMTEVDDLALARLLADAADRISLDLYRDAELLVVTKPDLAGRPWTEGQGAVASNRLLHAAVLAAIPGPAGRDPPRPAGTAAAKPCPIPESRHPRGQPSRCLP